MDQKKLRIWTLSTQCYSLVGHMIFFKNVIIVHLFLNTFHSDMNITSMMVATIFDSTP